MTMDFGGFISSYLFAILFFNGLLALIPAYIAGEKGRSFAGFWALSFFSTVLIGLIAVLAMPQSTSAHADGNHGGVRPDGVPDILKCPYCAEFVKSEAKICKYCRKSVEQEFSVVIESFRAEQVQRLQEQAEAEKLRLQELRVLENERDQRRIKYLNRAKSPIGITIISTIVVVIFGIGTMAIVQENANSEAIAQKEHQSVLDGEKVKQFKSGETKARIALVKKTITKCGIADKSGSFRDPIHVTSSSIQIGDLFVNLSKRALTCAVKKLQDAGIPSKRFDYYIVVRLESVNVD